ncbi:hypothetical protein O0S10_10445, partial [Methanocorpusculum sp. MG]
KLREHLPSRLRQQRRPSARTGRRATNSKCDEQSRAVRHICVICVVLFPSCHKPKTPRQRKTTPCKIIGTRTPAVGACAITSAIANVCKIIGTRTPAADPHGKPVQACDNSSTQTKEKKP